MSEFGEVPVSEISKANPIPKVESQANNEIQQGDINSRFKEAAEVGQNICLYAQHRKDSGYSNRLLDVEKIPKNLASNCFHKDSDPITEEDVQSANASSVKLAVEAAFLITESPETIHGMVENGKSLFDLKIILDKAKTLVYSRNETEIVDAGSLSLQRRNGNTDNLSSSIILERTATAFKNADAKISKRLDVVRRYLSH